MACTTLGWGQSWARFHAIFNSGQQSGKSRDVQLRHQQVMTNMLLIGGGNRLINFNQRLARDHVIPSCTRIAVTIPGSSCEYARNKDPTPETGLSRTWRYEL
jgi:hypothetical protein